MLEVGRGRGREGRRESSDSAYIHNIQDFTVDHLPMVYLEKIRWSL